jgi:hypothetical protein
VFFFLAGKWMFIPLKMVLIGIDPYPFVSHIMMKLTTDMVDEDHTQTEQTTEQPGFLI